MMARLSYRFLALLAAAASALPAYALYKVVGPDGKVTYTDQPPQQQVPGRVVPITSSATAAPDPSLPLELRQAAARYPVTLYTSPDCAPCDEARRLLRQRGIPHAERTVTSDADRAAWVGIVGGAEAPAIAIGAQSMRGLDTERWNQYLDAAGYPRESRLPANYRFPTAQPLVQPRPVEARRTEPTPPPREEPPTAGGFRF